MGRVPPPALGNNAIITMPIIFGHRPSISANTKMRNNALIAEVEIRLSARGCQLSHPNPVSAGNAAQACIAAVTHRSGMASPMMAGHSGRGGCASDCHTVAHALASRSTSCCECRGISVRSMERSSLLSPSINATSSPSQSARAAWSTAEGTHPPTTRDMRCCRPMPEAGPSCSQARQLRRRASKSASTASFALRFASSRRTTTYCLVNNCPR